MLLTWPLVKARVHINIHSLLVSSPAVSLDKSRQRWGWWGGGDICWRKEVS